jgi:predicted aspartyl protease
VITGTVNGHHELVIPVPVRNTAGQFLEVQAILDSGFTGSLTLPSAWISQLQLPWRSRTSAILANGNAEEFDVYAATILWNGSLRQILVLRRQRSIDVWRFGTRIIWLADLKLLR